MKLVLSGNCEDSVSKGRMRTQFTLYDDGSIKSTTKTWSDSKLSGFTGGVFIVFFDENDQEVCHTNMHQYGVNGKFIPKGPHDRTEQWSENISIDLISKIKKASIVHTHTPTNRVWKFIEDNKEDILKTAISIIKS